jgi:hypothetical protein
MPVPAIVQGGSSIYVSDIPEKNGRDAFSTGGAYLLQSQIDNKANKEDIPSVEGLASESYVNGIVGEINEVLDQINGEVI